MVGKKLLIIEDDIDLREGLHFSFEGDGYEVFDVGTGRDGGTADAFAEMLPSRSVATLGKSRTSSATVLPVP